MVIMVLVSGLAAALVAVSAGFRQVRDRIMRRFCHGVLLIRITVGVSLAAVVLSFATVTWFSENTYVGTVVFALLLITMGLGVIVFDRLRIISQPAVNRRTYLLVAAHPGDALYGAAATLAKLRDCHHEVHVVTLTNGRSDDDVDSLPQKCGKWAKFVGCHSMILGNIPVEQVATTQESIRELLRSQIEKHQPDVIFTNSRHDTDPERVLVADLVAQVATWRQTILGFQSPTTTEEFSPCRCADVQSYLPMKEYILRDYHRGWDHGVSSEGFEVIKAGCTTSL